MKKLPTLIFALVVIFGVLFLFETSIISTEEHDNAEQVEELDTTVEVLTDKVSEQGDIINDQSTEISELEETNSKLQEQLDVSEDVVNQLKARMEGQKYIEEDNN